MADSNAEAKTPSLAPLITKKPDDYYYGTRHFSDNTLDLICCCALFSTYEPDLVASFLRGDLKPNNLSSLENSSPSEPGNEPPITKDADLSDVHGPEVRGCFFQMLDDNHGIYQKWSREVPSTFVPIVNRTVQPLIDAGESHVHVRRWNATERIAEPIWKRGAEDNARSSKRFAKLADDAVRRQFWEAVLEE